MGAKCPESLQLYLIKTSISALFICMSNHNSRLLKPICLNFKPLILQTYNIWSSRFHCLQNQRFASLGIKDIRSLRLKISFFPSHFYIESGIENYPKTYWKTDGKTDEKTDGKTDEKTRPIFKVSISFCQLDRRRT